MLKGIDIYHGNALSPQDIITITKENELCFAFIKSSTGGNGKDSKFAVNWQQCRDAGLICSAYHWYWPLTDPTVQALNFVNQLKSVSRSGVMPSVVDIEWTYNSGDAQVPANELWRKIPPAQRIPKIKEFLLKVELELHFKPVIYTANSFWMDLIQPNASADDILFFSQYPLWIADPNNNGKLPKPWQKARFIQTHFGENAQNNTLYEHLDHDSFTGNLKDLLNSTLPGFTMMKGFPFSNIVKQLQQALKTAGHLTDTPDGFFGNHTRDAVVAFQQSAGLTGNGIVDAQTWNKLL